MLLNISRRLILNRLGIMGNSGGGTTSFYAACVDPRIKVCMPSCAFCPYYDSIIAFIIVRVTISPKCLSIWKCTIFRF